MLFRFSLMILLVAAVALGTPNKRDAVTVQSDITTVTNQVHKLDNTINAFPSSGGTVGQAVAIHNAAGDVKISLDTATKDIKVSVAFTNSESATTVGLMKNNLVPIAVKCLNDLVAKKAPITALAGGSTTKSDLQDIKTKTDALGQALLAKASAAQKADVKQQLSTMDSAFSNAINAFS